ncbi:MAG: CHRD domain-containing protein [Ktedonobacteraceae bacterium]|nr:CHRD domain-containing protein [Ktedonobacteraceae bacterium]
MSFLKESKHKLIMFGALILVLILAVFGGIASNIAASARDVEGNRSYALLQHTPYGYTLLKWDAKSENLTVTIKLVGLTQNSTHPAHIHLGDCKAMGPVKYMLNNVVANAAGVGTSSTVIKDVDGGIASGWSVNVHNGPMLAPADQFIPIACGNISNPHHEHALAVRLGATSAANQAAAGISLLTLKNHTLTVLVAVRGLVPGSVHAEHIHVGTCERQVPGTVMYMLKNLVADKNGNATAITVIKNVERIPEHAWYVNIHRTTMLMDQTGFDPIDCGNVQGK